MIAAIIAKRKKYIPAFRNANALSVRQAATLNDLGLRKGPIFKGLLRRRVIKKAGKELYYLDEVVEKNDTGKRRKAVLIAVIMMLIALAIVFGVFKQ